MTKASWQSPTVPGLNESAQGTLFILLVAAVLLALFLPGPLLTTVTGYTSPDGGNPVFKIHFYSYVLVLALAFVVACRGLIVVLSEQFASRVGVAQFAAVIASCATVLLLRHGTSSLAFMIDTLFVAPLAIMLSGYLTRERQYRIAVLVVWVIVLNATVAIGERLLGVHLMNVIPGTGDAYFRSTAFFGEPLANALITSAGMFFILGMQWPTWRKAMALALCLAGILAFGARGALVITTLLGLVTLLCLGVDALLRGRLRLSTLALAPWVLIVGLAGTAGLIFGTPLGERIVGLSHFDDSAEERLDAYRIFDYLSVEEVLAGVKASRINTILDTDYNVQILENFWIILLLMLGAVLFVALVASLLWFCASLIKGRGVVAFFAVLNFFLVASTNNSLATKSPALMLFALAMAGLPILVRAPRKLTKSARYALPRRDGVWT